MMAKSTKALLTGRIQMCKTNPSIAHIGLATHGRSIQIGSNIRSAAEAAEALCPLAGNLTFVLFALGIVGTGLRAVPVLAGSAAYCVAEAFGWPATLEAKAPDAVGFYSIIAAATVVGLALGYAPINPIQMLVLSAVL